jgi:methanogen homocitrate synthase
MESRHLTDQWCVSPYNFIDEVRSEMHFAPKITIHDCTLRDGEQHPGTVFTKEDKIMIAQALDEYGVDRIEIMPAVSQEDIDAIVAINVLGLKAEVVGFCRANVNDVAKSIQSGVHSVIIEVFASPYLLHALGWSMEQSAEKMIEATRLAKEHGLRVTNFIVDSTRTEWDDLRNFLDLIIEKGHPDNICLADSRGVLIPQAAYHFIRKAKAHLGLPLEFHGHNTFGLGTGVALAAVCAGAEVVHGAVNGLGQTANVALEEICLDLKIMLGIDTGIDYTKTYGLCKLVADLAGISLLSTKPLVGERVFTTEAGVGVSRLLKMAEKGIPLVPYADSIYPEFLGRKSEIVLGKKSGLSSIDYKLRDLGMPAYPAEIQQKILEQVKQYSLRHKSVVSDEAFKDIVAGILTSA